VTHASSAARLARFRAVVGRWLGLRFEESRSSELAEVLERLGGGAVESDGYLSRLESASLSRKDLRDLAAQLTVGETYFFRNPEQLRAFSEVVLHDPPAAKPASHKLRVLSAGCASGEEAYSLAILAAERPGVPPREVSITAIDVNAVALQRAATGRYSSWSLRETPADMRRRWFQQVGADYAVDASIRASVRFEERNLAAEEGDLWLPETYDVIFCRNVLMYLTPEAARAAMARMWRSLTADGHLFLGHAESMRDLSDDFHLCQTHGTFYYRRKSPGSRAPAVELDAFVPSARYSTPAPVEEANVGWIEAVRQSTDRVRVLSERSRTPPNGLPAAPPAANVAREVIALLVRERFAEALALLDGLPGRGGAPDPEALLLRAALLTHSGRFDAAETVCRELCGRDAKSAGAHYLLAICHEGAGDPRAAIEKHQVAAYLDPDFAMPHLHLGLLLRRAGDLSAAQRELERALALLAGEDAARIVLFGGGFTREALTRLCQTELRAAGGDS
jgi:chemotaxis protein methyltransferase CheR